MDLHVENEQLATNLHCARLHLRPFVATDAGQVTVLLNNIAVSRWLTKAPYPFTAVDGQGLVARTAQMPGRVWAITVDTLVVGLIGIHREFGYWLGQPYWGKGYLTEAANAVLAAWFRQADQPVMSGYMLGNDASKAVQARLGFRDVGPTSYHCVARNSHVPGRRMTLTQAHWTERHDK